MLDVKEILQCVPHRYPFLMLDRVLEIENGKKITALKNVTYNEPFFQGHFPGTPVMPGVLQIEAMAQAGAVMMMYGTPYGGSIAYLTTVEKARLRRPVVPGDQMIIHVEMWRSRGVMGKVKAYIEVDGEKVAEATLGFMLETNREQVRQELREKKIKEKEGESE